MTINANLKFRSDIPVVLQQQSGGEDEILLAMLASSRGTDVIDELGNLVDPNTGKPMSDDAKQGRINFLMKNRHGTPFEHGFMSFHMEAPIKVYRELHRHRVGWSFNEESGRYKELEPVFYVADRERKLVQEGKPGSYIFKSGTRDQYNLYSEQTRAASYDSYMRYQLMLEKGIAKEVARDVLPVNIYSSQWASANPRSIMNFLSLRTTRDAYWDAEDSGDWDGWYEVNPGGAMFPSKPMREIEMVADQIEEYFSGYWPMTYKAFNQFGRVAP